MKCYLIATSDIHFSFILAAAFCYKLKDLRHLVDQSSKLVGKPQSDSFMFHPFFASLL